MVGGLIKLTVDAVALWPGVSDVKIRMSAGGCSSTNTYAVGYTHVQYPCQKVDWHKQRIETMSCRVNL